MTSEPGGQGAGGTPRRHHRPVLVDPTADWQPGGDDPALRAQVAHATAAALVHRGRASDDPAVLDAAAACPMAAILITEEQAA